MLFELFIAIEFVSFVFYKILYFWKCIILNALDVTIDKISDESTGHNV